MKNLFFVSVLSMVGLAAPFSVNDCVNASDRELCFAQVLERKIENYQQQNEPDVALNRILYFYQARCTNLVATGYLPVTLTSHSLAIADKSCETIADVVNAFDTTTLGATVDSVLYKGTCTAIKISLHNKSAVKADCMSHVGE